MKCDKKFLHIPTIRVIISVGTLIPIRDTRMKPKRGMNLGVMQVHSSLRFPLAENV